MSDPNTVPSISASGQSPSAVPSQPSRVETSVTETGDHWRIWLIRLRAILFVTVCATFGVLLVVLPWTPRWTDNPLLLTSPELRQIVSSGFVRGFASGLGVLDLWLGFWEAIHYHER